MKIGVFFGGKNPEHDISIITGNLILHGLRKIGRDACAIYLDKDGKWRLGDELESVAFFGKRNGMDALGRWYLDLEKSSGKMVFKKKGFAGKTVAEVSGFTLAAKIYER